MNIIVADDEQLALESLIESINEALPDANVSGFRKASLFLEHLKNNPCDLAFLDIHMRGLNGMELAKAIKEIKPDTKIIFATGYSSYINSADSSSSIGYILKPASKSDVLREITNVNNIGPECYKSDIFVKTFGSFELYNHGKAVEFGSAKEKELFAMLIDANGSLLTGDKIAKILYPDKKYGFSLRAVIHTLAKNLLKTVKNEGLENIVVKAKTGLSIDKSKIFCDVYGFSQGNVKCINLYRGEYMTDYPWAEFTNKTLEDN